MVKRTAIVLSALLILAIFLPGVSLYAAAKCQRPCHPAPAKCHHQPFAASWGIPCLCGHDRDYRLTARLENESQPVSIPSAVIAAISSNSTDHLALQFGISATTYPSTSIFCLTRSYRI